MILRLEPVSGAAADPLSMLHRACFPEDPWDCGALTGITGIPGFFGQIALEEEIPTGFALALSLGTECEILSLGVVPERRGAGIGAVLLSSICLMAQHRGARCILLEVAADNASARTLYAKHGFTTVGTRPNYYRRAGGLVDALVLRRLLVPVGLAI